MQSTIFIFAPTFILLFIVVNALFKISKLEKDLKRTNYNYDTMKDYLFRTIKETYIEKNAFMYLKNDLVFYQIRNNYNKYLLIPALFIKVEINISYNFIASHNYIIKPFNSTKSIHVRTIYTLKDLNLNSELRKQVSLLDVPSIFRESIEDKLAS